MMNVTLTTLVRENGLANGTWPHPEACTELAGLRMASEMFPKAALVDVVLAAHGTRMIGGASFG